MSKALAQIQEVIEIIEWRQENDKEVNMQLQQPYMVKALILAMDRLAEALESRPRES